MRAVKPVNPIDKEAPTDPFLLERIKLAADAIRRGEKTYTVEEVFAEIDQLIKEKSSSDKTSDIELFIP